MKELAAIERSWFVDIVDVVSVSKVGKDEVDYSCKEGMEETGVSTVPMPIMYKCQLFKHSHYVTYLDISKAIDLVTQLEGWPHFSP